jgi:hypothetical protein
MVDECEQLDTLLAQQVFEALDGVVHRVLALKIDDPVGRVGGHVCLLS